MKKDLLSYAKSVHLAIYGQHIPADPHPNASDHPFEGYDLLTLLELVDNAPLKKEMKEFEKNLMVEVEGMYADLAINTPVKITKGSQDKRGTEGFILYAKEPLQGSGKALIVFDVKDFSTCYVRSSATKPRLPQPGERDQLKYLYEEGERLAPSFKAGTRVKLKNSSLLIPQKGTLQTNAMKDPNLDGAGFYLADVMWENGSRSTNLLTELEIV